jgi:hypothetical protein
LDRIVQLKRIEPEPAVGAQLSLFVGAPSADTPAATTETTL